jgi:hypothetical protein
LPIRERLPARSLLQARPEQSHRDRQVTIVYSASNATFSAGAALLQHDLDNLEIVSPGFDQDVRPRC